MLVGEVEIVFQPLLFFQMDIRMLYEDLTVAYLDARRHKRRTVNQLDFELNLEHNLYELASEIWDRRYSLKPSICFIVDKPVKREIFAANFRDRVVHHYVIGKVNHIFENQFIFDSYSCRVSKGTHFGVNRLDHFIRSATCNYTKPAYILKLDLRGFFMSINRTLLYSMVERLFTERYKGEDKDILLYLIKRIVFNDPTQGCIIKGKRSDWRGLPPTKSLFHARRDCGLPIGNLTSQIFANVYMSGFDRWMKEEKRCRYYGRYVDDFYVVGSDAKELSALVTDIREFLRTNLFLTLHPKKICLEPAECGVKYLGVCLKPYRRTIANRTKGNFYEALQMYNALMVCCDGNVTRELLHKVQSSYNSYTGIMGHYSTYNLIHKYVISYLDDRWLQWIVL